MNSGTALAGIDGFTTITNGLRLMPATGAASRTKLKFSLSSSIVEITFAAVTRARVYPSGDAFAMVSVALEIDWLSKTNGHLEKYPGQIRANQIRFYVGEI